MNLFKIKECYTSHNGITCFTNINTYHSLKIDKITTLRAKNTATLYISLRFIEFIITDFINNKNYLIYENSINNSSFLQDIAFN